MVVRVVALEPTTRAASPNAALHAYTRVARAEEPLALVGIERRAARYAGARATEAIAIADPNAAASWLLQGPGRRFLAIERSQLAPINAGYRTRGGRNVPMIEARMSDSLLLSDRLLEGESSDSPLAALVLEEPPPGLEVRRALFGDALELVGWSTITLRVHAGHLVALGFLAALLPQAAYLLSRNVALFWEPGAHGFAWRADLVRFGSVGNCSFPGQLPCSVRAPQFGVPPFAQGLAWIGIAVAISVLLVEERRRSRVLALGAWFFAALATIAKGPAGLVLPAATAVAWALASGRLRPLRHLAPLRGFLLTAALVLPWYVATWLRHGRLFVDDLVLRHMVGRTLEHLHDTNTSDDVSFRYYLAQLGFALLPWSGLVLLGLARAFRDRASRAERFLAIWALLAVAMMTVMRTKFHHYAFPALPPLAMLAGITFARPPPREALALAMFAAAIALAAGWSLISSRDPEGVARLIQLFTYRYTRAWPPGLDLRAGLGILVVAAGLAPLVLVAGKRVRVAVLVFAAAGALFIANVVLGAAAPHWGQRTIMDAWVRHRVETDAPLAAYQLNWKGQNFYTGNRLALFGVGASDRVSIKQWVATLRAGGTKTVLVVTERSRITALRAELADARVEEVTGPGDSRQFCLLRARL